MEEEKRRPGQPTKYLPDYCELLLEFFRIPLIEEKGKEVATNKGVLRVVEDEACELPMFVDFAEEVGVDMDTLTEWRKKHPEFSLAYKKAKKLQEQIIVKNGIKGRYNTTFALFFLKCNSGWNDKAAESEANRTFVLNYGKKDKEEE